MKDRGEGTPALTWKVELTLEELKVIEHALTRFSAREIDAQPGRDQSRAASLLSRVLGTTALTSGGTAVSTDEDSLMVSISNERFVCKPTSFRVLSHLIHHRGRWIRTEELRRQVLATAFEQDASNIRWHVLQARRALGSRANVVHSDNRLGFMFDLFPCARRHCGSERRR